MMESCGICFEVREGDEKAGIEAEYIAPDLLPERAAVQTELDALWGRQPPDEQATYAYDLLLPGLLRALTSRIGRQAGVSALYWRDGLCVYEASTGAHALIEQAMDAGWSGRIVVNTRGGRARELLERLLEWVEEEQNHLGLRPKERADEGDPELARRDRAASDPEMAPDMRFAAQPRTDSRRYVSYAWNDPSDPQREEQVDRLCDAATTRRTPIIRDKTAMTLGDSISTVHEGDRPGRPRLRFPQRQISQVAVLHVRIVRDLAQQPTGQAGIQGEGSTLPASRRRDFHAQRIGFDTPNTGARSMTNWRLS